VDERFVFKEYEAGVRRQLYNKAFDLADGNKQDKGEASTPLFASNSQASDHSDVPDNIQNCG